MFMNHGWYGEGYAGVPAFTVAAPPPGTMFVPGVGFCRIVQCVGVPPQMGVQSDFARPDGFARGSGTNPGSFTAGTSPLPASHTPRSFGLMEEESVALPAAPFRPRFGAPNGPSAWAMRRDTAGNTSFRNGGVVQGQGSDSSAAQAVQGSAVQTPTNDDDGFFEGFFDDGEDTSTPAEKQAAPDQSAPIPSPEPTPALAPDAGGYTNSGIDAQEGGLRRHDSSFVLQPLASARGFGLPQTQSSVSAPTRMPNPTASGPLRRWGSMGDGSVFPQQNNMQRNFQQQQLLYQQMQSRSQPPSAPEGNGLQRQSSMLSGLFDEVSTGSNASASPAPPPPVLQRADSSLFNSWGYFNGMAASSESGMGAGAAANDAVRSGNAGANDPQDEVRADDDSVSTRLTSMRSSSFRRRLNRKVSFTGLKPTEQDIALQKEIDRMKAQQQQQQQQGHMRRLSSAGGQPPSVGMQSQLPPPHPSGGSFAMMPNSARASGMAGARPGLNAGAPASSYHPSSHTAGDTGTRLAAKGSTNSMYGMVDASTHASQGGDFLARQGSMHGRIGSANGRPQAAGPMPRAGSRRGTF